MTASVELRDTWLRLFVDGDTFDFHHRWLRHAASPRHPVTNEVIACSSEIADDIRPLSAAIVDRTLRVEWSDRTESKHPLAWLVENAYARNRDAHDIPSRVAAVEIDARETEVTAIDETLGRLARFGLAMVRGFSSDTEAVVQAFEKRSLAVRATHFGRIEDLRTDNTTNANTDQLGYTDAGIELHTDQPFLPDPPRYQLLHCMRTADEGGESFIVDARAAERHFDAEDGPACELLRTTSIRFHRRQKAFERVVLAPVLGQAVKGEPVRFSYFTLAPHRVDFAYMRAYYRAYDAFTRLVRAPKNQYRFALSPGDFVIYDNHRMLHGRTAFRGPRWLRGVYFDPV